MPTTSPLSRSQLIRFVLAVIVLLVCAALYSGRSETYPWKVQSTASVANPGVLSDEIPADTLSVAVNHIAYYLAANNVPGKHIIVTDKPSYDTSGDLTFSFKTDESTKKHPVIVTTTSFGGGISSNTVSINYSQVSYAPAKALYDTAFMNFDNLTDNGLSGVQAYEIEALLMRNLSGRNYAVDTSTISQSNNGGQVVVNFDIDSGASVYHAQAVAPGASAINLTLDNLSNKQIFSGRMDLSN